MNPVVHFEMPYKVAVRAKIFYEKVFGWKTEQLGSDMGGYILCTTVEEDAKPGNPAGAINGGMFPFKPDWPDQYPSIVLGVGDIEETMQKITEHGGEVLGKPTEIADFGWYVSFRDTEGNRNSLMQPNMQ